MKKLIFFNNDMKSNSGYLDKTQHLLDRQKKISVIIYLSI